MKQIFLLFFLLLSVAAGAQRLTVPNPTATGQAAGGHLTGTYPNPQIAAGVVDSNKLAAMGAATGDILKISNGKFKPGQDNTLSNTDVLLEADRTIDLYGFDLLFQGVVNNNGVTRVLAYDSITGALNFIHKSTLGGGGSGTLTGTGTTGTIPVWSGATALGDSPLTVASGSVTATGTGHFRLPNGTTAERPGTPAAGMTRYNTTNGAFEWYGASAWEVGLRSAAGTTGLGTATYLPYSDANGRQAFISTYRADMTGTNFFVFGGNTTLTGIRNTAIGDNAGLSLTTGSNNNFFGRDAGRNTTTGNSNNAYGNETGKALTEGVYNNFFGDQAGVSTTTGSYNVAIGYRALFSNQTHSAGIAIGWDAGYTSKNTGGIYIGYRAGYLSTTNANFNTMIGYESGYNNTTGYDNVYIGRSAGRAATTGFGNTFLGYAAGDNTGAGADKNVIIGFDLDLPSSTGDNQLTISNLIFGTGASSTGTSIPAGGKVGIKVAAPARDLEVAGEVRITDLTTDTPTRVVGADADGDLGAIPFQTLADTLENYISITGTTNLAFTGTSSPVTLTSDTGTDVNFAAGSGLAASQSGGTLTYSRTYSEAWLSVSGGGTTVSAATPERLDADTGGTATSSVIGSEFSVSGSTIDWTGAGGTVLKISGTVSFSVSDNTDMLVSIYKEGSEIAATEVRVTMVAGDYHTVHLPEITTTASSNDTFAVFVEPVSGTVTTTGHRYNLSLIKLY